MPSAKLTIISALAALLSVQLVPAPPVLPFIGVVTTKAVIGGVAGAVGQIAEDAANKRDVPEFKPWSRAKRQQANKLGLGLGTAPEQCKQQLTAAYLTFDEPSHNVLAVSGIPPACMTLLTVITGTINAGNPIPMGADSAQFTNLSDADMQEVRDALSARKATEAQGGAAAPKAAGVKDVAATLKAAGVKDGVPASKTADVKGVPTASKTANAKGGAPGGAPKSSPLTAQ